MLQDHRGVVKVLQVRLKKKKTNKKLLNLGCFVGVFLSISFFFRLAKSIYINDGLSSYNDCKVTPTYSSKALRSSLE